MSSDELISTADIERLASLYSDFKLPQLSYGTVRDFCDSFENIGPLSWLNGDLKDQQRCWIIKAILGNVQRGARILEIGAGEPFVADILSRAGYKVTVVDPYDGSGNGPVAAEAFASRFPGIKFVVDRFGPDLNLIGTWECFYSISVLEHIPIDKLSEIFLGTQKFGAPGHMSIHAVDHVLQGRGDDYHRKMLGIVAYGLGIPESVLNSTLKSAAADTETYFLSAEGHNRWRGKLPYDEFPMRRCISMQFCSNPQFAEYTI